MFAHDSEQAPTGGLPKMVVLFGGVGGGGPYNTDSNIWGSIFGVPLFRATTKWVEALGTGSLSAHPI